MWSVQLVSWGVATRCSARLACVSRLSTSPGLRKDNPEYVRVRDERRRQVDRNWRRYERNNPFRGNPGMARGLKAIEMDANDSAAADYERASSDPHPHTLAETALEASEKHDRLMHQGPIYKEKGDRARLSRILTKKNFFPDPKPPSLLTWMEKQIIRQLHQSDKEAYSAEKLADQFPATRGTIAKILKSRVGYWLPENIREHDQEVRDNWKLLAKGKLDISPELEEHIRSMGDPAQWMSDEQRRQLVQMALDANEAQKELPKPKVGAMGALVADYNRKVDALKKKAQISTSDTQTELKTNSSLFSNKSEYDPMLEGPNPFKDTALLASDISFTKERRMTMDSFRKKYLRVKTENDDNEERRRSKRMLSTKTAIPFNENLGPNRMGDEQAKRLFKLWLAKEEAKDNRERHQRVDVDAVVKEMEEDRRDGVW